MIGICNTTWYRNHTYYEVPWRGNWDTELGGVSMGHGIHAMDMFLWLMGDWAETSAIIGTLDRNIEVEDVSMAHVRFSNGALGSIVNSVLSPREVSYVRFDFQRRRLNWNIYTAIPTNIGVSARHLIHRTRMIWNGGKTSVTISRPATRHS